MPRITIGNEAHLKALSEDDLKLLVETSKMEIVRRRVEANPNIRRQTANVDGRVRYVTWEEVKEILRPYYPTEKKASFHASRVWGELYTETCQGLLDMEGYCGFCKVAVRKRKPHETWTSHRIGCPSRGANSAKPVLFSRRSLVACRDEIMALSDAWMPQWVKDDYQRVIDGLRPRRT